MSQWKVRHEGSPEYTEGLTDREIMQGVQDGIWEPTDEVMGPSDTEWHALDQHPHFADAMIDFEPEPPPERPDETRLDMNPLIDVALVLLIFFILTTTYQSLRRVINVPTVGNEEKGAQAIPRVKFEDLRDQVIIVQARMENDRPVILVESNPVEESDLEDELTKVVERTGKTKMLLNAQGVKWGTYVKILDAGRGAGITETIQQVQPSSAPTE